MCSDATRLTTTRLGGSSGSAQAPRQWSDRGEPEGFCGVSEALSALVRGATLDPARTTTTRSEGGTVATWFQWAPSPSRKRDPVATWVRDHHLTLAGLSPRTRTSASVALFLCAVSSGLLLAHWYADQSARSDVEVSTARLAASVVLAYAGHVLAALALCVGSTLIAVASLSPQWRMPRLTQLLLSWVAINLIAGPLIYAGQGLATIPSALATLSRLTSWIALLTVLVVTARCMARRPPRSMLMALTFLLPFVAAAINTIVIGAVRGWGIGKFPYQPMYVSSRFLLWYLAFTVLPVIVLWLTVEGLRLNRDVGVRLVTLARVTPRRVALLAGAKVAIVVLLLAAVPGTLTDAAGQNGLSILSVLTCLPLALGLVVVLALENRWQLQERSFEHASRLLVVMAAAWCSVWAVSYGLATLFLMLVLRPLNLIGYLICSVVAVLAVTGRILIRRRWVVGCFAVALAATLSVLPSLGMDPTITFPVSVEDLLGTLATTVGWFSGVSSVLLPVAVLVCVLLWRRDLIVAAVIVVLASAWVALSARLEPLALDLALCVLIVLAAYWSAQRSVRTLAVQELALLALVVGSIAYAPLMTSLLPGAAVDILKPLVFVAPIVLMFTLDAPMLNERGPTRRIRVLGVIGGACFLSGVALSWSISADAEDAFAFVELGKGLFTLPMALALVVLSSSALRNLEGGPGVPAAN